VTIGTGAIGTRFLLDPFFITLFKAGKELLPYDGTVPSLYSASQAKEVEGALGWGNGSFLVLSPETDGTVDRVDAFAGPLDTYERVLVVDTTTTVLKKELKDSFDLSSVKDVRVLARVVKDFGAIRNRFGGTKPAVFIIQVPSDATKAEVSKIMADVDVMKKVAGEWLVPVVCVRDALRPSDELPLITGARFCQAAIDERAAAERAAAANRPAIEWALALVQRAGGFGLTTDQLNDLAFVEELLVSGNPRALEKARNIYDTYVEQGKQGERTALKLLAAFGDARKAMG